jgi:hypothetical protein
MTSALGGRRSLSAMFLGKDLLPYMLLAFGGAMAVGNVLAVVRPPKIPREGAPAKAPLARSLTMAGIGLIAAVWAIATLIRQ